VCENWIILRDHHLQQSEHYENRKKKCGERNRELKFLKKKAEQENNRLLEANEKLLKDRGIEAFVV
jgi:flagellar motility protein MotE (MotC chaperone)